MPRATPVPSVFPPPNMRRHLRNLSSSGRSVMFLQRRGRRGFCAGRKTCFAFLAGPCLLAPNSEQSHSKWQHTIGSGYVELRVDRARGGGRSRCRHRPFCSLAHLPPFRGLESGKSTPEQGQQQIKGVRGKRTNPIVEYPPQRIIVQQNLTAAPQEP